MRPITSLLPLNLQLFADGGASAGASTGGNGGNTGTNQGDNAYSALRVPDKARHILDKMPKAAVNSSADESGSNTAEQSGDDSKKKAEKVSFADLIKSDEYAEDAQQHINKIIGKRIAKYKGVEESNQAMRAILDKVSMRYGIDNTTDNYLEQLSAAVDGDSKLFEEEALNAGMSSEEYVKVKTAERIMAQNRLEQEQRQRNEVIDTHVRNLTAQAEQFKTQFPAFDLEAELNDPQFRKLVDPPELGGIGISVENAYHALHHKDIMQATVHNAVEQATVNAAGAMQKNLNRPTEGGIHSKTSDVTKTDPSTLKLEDFRRIQEEYRRTGKKPSF